MEENLKKLAEQSNEKEQLLNLEEMETVEGGGNCGIACSTGCIFGRSNKNSPVEIATPDEGTL